MEKREIDYLDFNEAILGWKALYDFDLPHTLVLLYCLYSYEADNPGSIPSWILYTLSCVCGITLVVVYQSVVILSAAGPRRKADVFILVLAATFVQVFTLRPLQLAFRLLTAPLRVEPDVIIVGEVRCGTTTAATMLNKFPGCHPPFTYVKFSPAEGKETHILGGLYFGLIHPYFLRSSMPTVFEKWWCKKVLGRPFFCYDATATTSSIVPWGMANLRRGYPNAKIIYCVRDPVQMSISWWSFMRTRNQTPWRRPCDGVVHPEDFEAAWRRSCSSAVEEEWQHLKQLGEEEDRWFVPVKHAMLPMPWWEGLARVGRLTENIRRAVEAFGRDAVQLVDLGGHKTESGRAAILRQLAASLPPGCSPPETLERLAAQQPVHENSCKPDLTITPALKAEMQQYFAERNKGLEQFLSRRIDWVSRYTGSEEPAKAPV